MVIKDRYMDSSHYCPICGREFFVPIMEEWVYRSCSSWNAILFCSWKCLQHWRRNKPTRAEQRQFIIQMIRDHPEMGNREIAKTLNEQQKKVSYWREKLERGETA